MTVLVGSNTYGPDNPRDWDPNHRTLTSAYAPHETAAVLRCLQAGNVGEKLFKIFKRSYRGSQLSEAIQKALDEETKARDMRREICNGSTA